MKFLNRLIIAVIILSGISSCSKNLAELNNDPENPNDLSYGALYTYGQLNLSYIITNSSVNYGIFRLVEQYWQETTYTDESQYDFITRNIPDGNWDFFYANTIKNLEEASEKAEEQITTDTVQLANVKATIDLMKITAFYYLLTTYGNVPYTDALDVVNKTFPKYDDAMTAYKDLLIKLDSDITVLKANETGNGIGTADAIYNGDITKWEKYANSLKLKMGITIADADAALAQTTVESALKAGIFTSNADNAFFAYSSTPPNTNPIWIDLVQSGRQDFVGCSTLISFMDSIHDPRLPLFFTTDEAGAYSGGNPGSSSSYAQFSKPATTITAANFRGVFLDYAELQFYLAEAAERGYSVGENAETYYKNGIESSILDWGGSQEDAETYYEQPTVAYTLAGGTWQKKIGIQAWIALYNRGFDGWIETRKLDYPKLPTPKDAVSDFPERFTYPVSEGNVNSVNWAAAGEAIGGDDVTTKLFFDKF